VTVSGQEEDALGKIQSMGPGWRKSSRSGNNNCVEVLLGAALVRVRDSQDHLGPTLSFSSERWRAFVAALRTGEIGSMRGCPPSSEVMS